MVNKQTKQNKHPGGRPSLYKHDMPDRVRAYTKDFFKIYSHQIPTICGLACTLGVTPRTIERWSKDEEKAEFCYALEQLKDKQEMVLLNKGLRGKFNSAIVSFLLINNHGYKKRSNRTSRNKSIRPVVISFSDLLAHKEGEHIVQTGE